MNTAAINIRAYQCVGKAPYGSHTDAQTVAMRIRKRGAEKPVNVYRCSHCRKWHIGGRYMK